jgi:uncharacterized RDD family membrane protein YckC
MENRIRNIKIRRFLAFVYDIPFILLLAFTFHMLFGLIFKLDSEVFSVVMIYVTLAIIISYLLLGEFLFKNTIGKYLFGIEVVSSDLFDRPSLTSFIKRGLLKIIFPVEGLVLLFSHSKKRLGDQWSKTIVVNKETNKVRTSARFMIGIAVLIVLYFSFSFSMGLAARKTDFYKAGADYLAANGQVRITGLPKVVNQSRDSVDFGVPVSVENLDRFVCVYLGKSEGKWVVYKTVFFNENLGTSYGYSF